MLEIWCSRPDVLAILWPDEAEIVAGPPGRPPAAARAVGFTESKGVIESLMEAAVMFRIHTFIGLGINLAEIHKWF